MATSHSLLQLYFKCCRKSLLIFATCEEREIKSLTISESPCRVCRTHGLLLQCTCISYSAVSSYIPPPPPPPLSLSLSLSLQHNLFCDNCHSHVARAFNLMRYDGSSSWNMCKLGFLMLLYSKYTRYGDTFL